MYWVIIILVSFGLMISMIIADIIVRKIVKNKRLKQKHTEKGEE